MHNKVYRLNRAVAAVFVIFLMLMTLLSGCADEQSDEQLSETRLLLDTFCTITIHGNVSSKLLDEAFALCEEYEALFSITMEDSDVWRINHAEGEPVSVDSRTIEVIEAGLEFSELSDGMFDITIGRVSRLWNFGSEPFMPSSAELETALSTVDHNQVRIVGDTVQLVNPDAWIDLGAIAKGYIGDKVAQFLTERGVSGALISLGGDIITVGNRQDGSPWRIALRDPFGTDEDRLGVIEASGISVISSGTYERKFEVDGVYYHHILDPSTGMPAISDVVSATVLMEDAIIGEGLSTAAVLMGSKRAVELFDRVGGLIGAALVLENGEMIVFGDMRLSG